MKRKFLYRSVPCFLSLAACLQGLPVHTAAQQRNDNIHGYTHHFVMVNQGGYNTGAPKRFTAPVTADGAAFTIAARKERKALYSGTIRDGVGDFSDFRPEASGGEYVVRVSGGKLAEGVSFPFSVGTAWLENASCKPALDFMIDDRSVTGTHPSAYGGCPWRDGTYYSFEVPSLILQYMANPDVYMNLPVTLDYEADKARISSPSFHYILDRNGQDAYHDAQAYYEKVDPPVGSRVPDIIQLIHWGIGYYLMDPVTADPSGDSTGNRVHAQTVEQFAFFLYAYPYFKQYFTDRFYKQARDLAFDQWAKTGLFEVIKTVGSGKGRECPGHSILPNLLMFEVAKREGRSDARRFFDAAFRQTQWVISSLDWHDPRTTKGQRMSEHKLMPGLVYFLQQYPHEAPEGLRQKIGEWADVMIARSDNMWDFRRYDTTLNWSIPEYNEPGNLAGFPACALSAAAVLKDAAKRQRLEELAFAALDNLFGRNPLNAASPNHPEMGFPYLEKGWPKAFSTNTCARLETARGTLNSSCSTEMYPFNPGGKFRHPEGWTAFNAAWNAGLAYLSWHDTRLALMNSDYAGEETAYRAGDPLFLQLQAPLNLDSRKPESAKVALTASNGFHRDIPVKETAPNSSLFRAEVPASFMREAMHNGNISWIEVAYGDGFFRKKIRLVRHGSRYKYENKDEL